MRGRRQVEDDKRTLPSRLLSFSAHLNETQNDVNLIKEAFNMLSKLVCALIVFIVVLTWPFDDRAQVEIQDSKLNILLSRSEVGESQSSQASDLSICFFVCSSERACVCVERARSRDRV